MNKNIILLIILSLTALLSCREEFDKYERPDWLKGKLYSQIENTEDLDSFAVCLQMSGMDSIINRSGSFTVFAPVNQAFVEYFASHPAYNSIADIPRKELSDMVKYQILQNSWTKNQMQQLDIYGWIDPLDPNNDQPRGYKRQTLLYEPHKKYWVQELKGEAVIVDSTKANDYKMAFSSSRKYVPLFFDDFLESAKITRSDYEYYFDRPYDPGNIYVAGAKLVSPEIYAENGVVYKTDKVVDPLMNAEQFMADSDGGNDYSSFLELVHNYGTFNYNSEETEKIPGYAEGLDVDSLYNLSFPELIFDVNSELTGPGVTNSIYTIRYQFGLIAPTNEALRKLYDNVVTNKSGYPHWASVSSLPENVKQIIVNSHMTPGPVYESNINTGFLNGERDTVNLDPSSIIQRSYGSNSTFLGVNEPIVPRAFSSVTGPVYLRPGYSVFRQAMEYTNLLAAVKRRNANYSFFVIPDDVFLMDSSLEVRYLDKDRFIMRSFNRADERYTNRSSTELTIQLLNQVGTRVPSGIPDKEFIPNLAGNYIVYEAANNIVSGGTNSVFGYGGDSIIEIHPTELEEPSDNGKCYRVNGWLSFPKSDLFSAMQAFPEFYRLLKKAGLLDDQVYYRLTFISPGENYTVFAPSDSALQSMQLDTLEKKDLAQLLKYHFVKGNMVFTDGYADPGEYQTLRVDETSTIYNTRYSVLNLDPGIDKIDIKNQDGEIIYSVNQEDEKTNMMTSKDIDEAAGSENYITTAVVHKINTVLIKQ